MDLYSYAGGDPVNFVDPTGRARQSGIDATGKDPGYDLNFNNVSEADRRYLNYMANQPVQEPNWWQSLLGIAPKTETPHTNLAAIISGTGQVNYGNPTAANGPVLGRPGDSTPGYNVTTYNLGNPNQAFDIIYAAAGPATPQISDAAGNGNLSYTDSFTSPQSGVRQERAFYSYSSGSYHRPELGRRIDGNRSTNTGAGLAVASRALNVAGAALSGDRTVYVYEQQGLFAPDAVNLTVHIEESSGVITIYENPGDVSRFVNESLDAVGIDTRLEP